MVRSEDITLYDTPRQTSARNNFAGSIVDTVPARGAIEVIVSIGRSEPMEIAALVTAESARALDLCCGKKAWVSFKVSAARYMEK